MTSGFRFATGPAGNLRYSTGAPPEFDDKTVSPDFEGFAVTPADGSDLPTGQTDAVYVTGAGNVNVQLLGGGTAVLTGLSAGQILPIAVTRILSTSTTATGIFALYRRG